MTADMLAARLAEFEIAEAVLPKVIETLLWYGFLGLVNDDGSATYIYHVGYNVAVLNGIPKAFRGTLLYEINPAFWHGLHIAAG